jgi:hypothetical protein
MFTPHVDRIRTRAAGAESEYATRLVTSASPLSSTDLCYFLTQALWLNGQRTRFLRAASGVQIPAETKVFSSTLMRQGWICSSRKKPFLKVLLYGAGDIPLFGTFNSNFYFHQFHKFFSQWSVTHFFLTLSDLLQTQCATSL